MIQRNISILIATHKKYKMPKEDIYLPIQVGKEGKEDLGYLGDNTGDNISNKNKRFCELTGIYWAWKNIESSYIGLVHYRRHFTCTPKPARIGRNKLSLIISSSQIEHLMQLYDLLVPYRRKYYIETIRSHYIHLPYTYEKDLIILEDVIKEMYPEFLIAYETVMNRNWAHMFNMFVMKKKLFNQYCSWMFSILFEVDKRIDVAKYNDMEMRAVAYLGEFMLDIWLEKNPVQYKEVEVMFMEKQNWFLKGGKFLVRKFRFLHR